MCFHSCFCFKGVVGAIRARGIDIRSNMAPGCITIVKNVGPGVPQGKPNSGQRGGGVEVSKISSPKQVRHPTKHTCTSLDHSGVQKSILSWVMALTFRVEFEVDTPAPSINKNTIEFVDPEVVYSFALNMF